MAALLGSVEMDPRLSFVQISAPLNSVEKTIERGLGQGTVVLAHSVMSTQLDRVRSEIRGIRTRFGNRVIIVAGGPHASTRPKDLLDIGCDYVVIGEGEAKIRELLWYLEHGKDPAEIMGIVGPESESIPIPRDLSRISLDDYPPFAIGMNILGPVEVTRGCPYSCKFCATPFLTGGIVRHRSVESITHWLEQAIRKDGFERTWFLSPNALCYGGRGRKAEPEKLETLLKETTKRTGIEVFFGSFPSEVRPEFVTSELLEMFRGYVSNRTLQIGLQSGSDSILQQANRHHSVQDGLNAIAIAKDTGFIPHVDMIFGIPGETARDVDANLEMCEELVKLDAIIHAHVFMPLPGSEWESMPAGKLDLRTRQILGDMSRRKKVTGSWSHQEGLGKRLEFKDQAIAKC